MTSTSSGHRTDVAVVSSGGAGARSRLASAVVRVSRALNRSAEAFIIVDLAAMTAIVIADVIARSTVSSIVSSEELGVRFLGTWFVFIGASVAFKRGQLVSITFFMEMLPRAVQVWIQRIAGVLIASFIGMVLYFGIDLVLFNFSQPSPIMGIPMGLAYLGVPVGAALMLVHAFALVLEGKAASVVRTIA